MDIKDLLAPAASLVCVAFGWALNELSARNRWKRERSTRLMELRVENYAEWTAGMEESLADYASQKDESQYRTPLCEKRLMIIETDPGALRLIRAVHNSIPAFQSKDYNDLNALAHSDPEWEWPPFREKMTQLLEHIRRRSF